MPSTWLVNYSGTPSSFIHGLAKCDMTIIAQQADLRSPDVLIFIRHQNYRADSWNKEHIICDDEVYA